MAGQVQNLDPAHTQKKICAHWKFNIKLAQVGQLVCSDIHTNIHEHAQQNIHTYQNMHTRTYIHVQLEGIPVKSLY